MSPQELKEELLQREAYALGYQQGSRDVIMSITQKLQKEQALKETKEQGESNG